MEQPPKTQSGNRLVSVTVLHGWAADSGYYEVHGVKDGAGIRTRKVSSLFQPSFLPDDWFVSERVELDAEQLGQIEAALSAIGLGPDSQLDPENPFLAPPHKGPQMQVVYETESRKRKTAIVAANPERGLGSESRCARRIIDAIEDALGCRRLFDSFLVIHRKGKMLSVVMNGPLDLPERGGVQGVPGDVHLLDGLTGDILTVEIATVDPGGEVLGLQVSNLNDGWASQKAFAGIGDGAVVRLSSEDFAWQGPWDNAIHVGASPRENDSDREEWIVARANWPTGMEMVIDEEPFLGGYEPFTTRGTYVVAQTLGEREEAQDGWFARPLPQQVMLKARQNTTFQQPESQEQSAEETPFVVSRPTAEEIPTIVQVPEIGMVPEITELPGDGQGEPTDHVPGEPQKLSAGEIPAIVQVPEIAPLPSDGQDAFANYAFGESQKLSAEEIPSIIQVPTVMDELPGVQGIVDTKEPGEPEEPEYEEPVLEESAYEDSPLEEPDDVQESAEEQASVSPVDALVTWEDAGAQEEAIAQAPIAEAPNAEEKYEFALDYDAAEVQPERCIQVGSIIANRYRILEKLGEDSVSIAWLATEMDGNAKGVATQWAVREFRRSSCEGDKGAIVDTFLESVEFVRPFNHPSLPRIAAVLGDENSLYIVMGLLQGYSLRFVLDEDQEPITEAEIVYWSIQLCDALDYLHQRDVLYLGLKPQNVLLKSDGSVALTGFDITKAVKDALDNGRAVPHVGMRGYSAPELFAKNVHPTPASDVYSLGALMFRLATGQTPVIFEGAPTLPSINWFNRRFSKGLEKIVAKATQPLPQNRYASCALMCRDLETLLQEV